MSNTPTSVKALSFSVIWPFHFDFEDFWRKYAHQPVYLYHDKTRQELTGQEFWHFLVEINEQDRTRIKNLLIAQINKDKQKMSRLTRIYWEMSRLTRIFRNMSRLTRVFLKFEQVDKNFFETWTSWQEFYDKNPALSSYLEYFWVHFPLDKKTIDIF